MKRIEPAALVKLFQVQADRATRAAERQSEALWSIANSLRDVCAVFAGAAKEVQRISRPKVARRTVRR